jgi:AraC-like DNA-binding protein
VLLFLFPKILFDTISYPNESKYNIPHLKSSLFKKANHDEINKTINTLLIHYLETIPFIGSHFSLTKMALDLKISERVLSNYFNTELSITFSKWKNDLRIDYACSMIENGKADKITVEGISLNVGFSSRSKFIDAFKERKGVLPSAYIKQFNDF